MDSMGSCSGSGFVDAGGMQGLKARAKGIVVGPIQCGGDPHEDLFVDVYYKSEEALASHFGGANVNNSEDHITRLMEAVPRSNDGPAAVIELSGMTSRSSEVPSFATKETTQDRSSDATATDSQHISEFADAQKPGGVDAQQIGADGEREMSGSSGIGGVMRKRYGWRFRKSLFGFLKKLRCISSSLGDVSGSEGSLFREDAAPLSPGSRAESLESFASSRMSASETSSKLRGESLGEYSQGEHLPSSEADEFISDENGIRASIDDRGELKDLCADFGESSAFRSDRDTSDDRKSARRICTEMRTDLEYEGYMQSSEEESCEAKLSLAITYDNRCPLCRQSIGASFHFSEASPGPELPPLSASRYSFVKLVQRLRGRLRFCGRRVWRNETAAGAAAAATTERESDQRAEDLLSMEDLPTVRI